MAEVILEGAFGAEVPQGAQSVFDQALLLKQIAAEATKDIPALVQAGMAEQKKAVMKTVLAAGGLTVLVLLVVLGFATRQGK